MDMGEPMPPWCDNFSVLVPNLCVRERERERERETETETERERGRE